MEVDELRVRYRAATDAYYAHAANIARKIKSGESPLPSELQAEEQALAQLVRVRRQLFDAFDAIR
jgi:hypothetical protein